VFVEWPLVVVRGRRDPRCFAEVLPSEDGGEHPGEARWRSTCMWGRLVGYPDRGVYALARVFP
jgi:hypothetical protein